MMEVRPPRRDHSDRTLLIYARVETVDTVADDGMLCCYCPVASAIIICSIPSLENVGVGGAIKMVLINMEE